MARSNVILTNFTAGEISPRMGGRTDLSKYFNACRQQKNSIILVQGGTCKRPGTYFVCEVKNSAKKVRVVPFEFSTTQAYILEFGDKYIRFYRNSGQIQNSYSAWTNSHLYSLGDLVTSGTGYYRCITAHTSIAAPGTFSADAAKWEATGGATDLAYEIPSPYVEADLFDLKFEQSADVLYIAHRSYNPRKLTRTGHTSWTLTVQVLSGSPARSITNYSRGDDRPISFISNANPGVVTCIDHGFSNGDVVYLADISGMVELNGSYQTVANASQHTFEIIDTSFASPYSSGGNAALTGAFAGITVANPGVVHAASHGFSNGDVVKMEGIGGMVELEGTYQTVAGVTRDTFQIEDTSAMTPYTLGGTATRVQFYGTGNYPSCVAFFEERLGYAGTTNKPQTLWMSVSGDYENFQLGSNADDALEFTLNSDIVNSIEWMVSHAHLMLGTTGGIWKVSGQSSDPVSPTGISSRRQSTRSSSSIQGMLMNDTILFLQKGGKKIREVVYDYRTDGYNTPDLTIMADHILTGNPSSSYGLYCWDYQQEPETIVWGVRKDGVLLGLTYEKDQEVIGWHPHYTDGSFESVAVIPGTSEDQIWVSVARTINGATKRYVEYFKPRDYGSVKRDAFFVDCGLTFDGGAEVDITNITSANPPVVTAPSHGMVDGDHVKFHDVEGMTEVNDRVYKVKKVDNDNFHLHDESGTDVDGSGYTAYSSGGTIEKVAKTFSGLSHLEGEEVSICADGGAIDPQTVSSGSITTDGYYNTVHVGLSFEWLVEPMKLDVAASLGTSQGQPLRLDHVIVRFYESASCSAGPDEDSQTPIVFDPQDEELFTGDKRVSFRGRANRERGLVLTCDDPLPVTVLAIMAEGTLYERNANV